MPTKINAIPLNQIPEEWAFHPKIGPFIRSILDIIFQTKSRTGGDTDVIYILQNDLSAIKQVTTGSTTINCGAIGTFSSIKTQTITATGMPATAHVSAVIRGQATTEHSIDEIVNDAIDVRTSNIQAGQFDANVICENGAIYGNYIIDWSWIDGS